MGSGVRDSQPSAILSPGDGPGIGRARSTLSRSTVVMIRRAGTSIGVRRAGVDPAPIGLGRGHLVPGEIVRDGSEIAIGRDLDLAKQAAAVGQVEVLDNLTAGCVDHRHRGGDDSGVGPVARQVMGYQQRLAIGRDRQGDRLRADANPHLLGSKRQLECHHALIEAITDIEGLAIRRNVGLLTVCPQDIVLRRVPCPASNSQIRLGAVPRVTYSRVPWRSTEVLRDLPVTRTGVGSRRWPDRGGAPHPRWRKR